MKVIEILKLSESLLKAMSSFDLRQNDWKYIAMYEEYRSLRDRGIKYAYVLAELSDKYGISESTLKRIVKRFSKTVTL